MPAPSQPVAALTDSLNRQSQNQSASAGLMRISNALRDVVYGQNGFFYAA